ncbi:acyl-CoA thioester hydrolase/BAAT C-terminal domain-containing protein [Haladaptatus sp. DYF46]|uniref:acyl-CoA thioester hydrolase/BAAT C-terminal domain-containing protein n=1 Tax=Haladaptatus sp. DYF46 TaxID=2886041 RepID=UPI001E64C674|nr:acyl-CoA thioester hydrolase/BAAT C-terminal domain-containing protein [Haladaptatus sp. DYF46]
MVLHRLSFESLFGSSPNFLMGEQNSVTLSLQARSGLFGPSTPRISQSRVLTDPEISRRSVEANGLVGCLYEPPTPGPHPGVLTLHGASASIPHRLSEMLATHGYTTFAVQYFDAPGLPGSLERIPLEYFDMAIRWLTNRPGVLDSGVGLLGISRGVEAALLTAIEHDGPVAVVGYSGGGVVRHGVAGVPPRAYISRPAWTRNGSRIAKPNAIRTVFDAIENHSRDRCHAESLPDAIRSRVPARVLEQVLVPVEQINGPVLLFAGGDDQQWPSTAVSALTVDRLRRNDHSFPFGLRTYCNSGHIFGVPYADYTGAPTNDANGGGPRANARAAADSWPTVLDYLDYRFQ